jgi:hypothetical protein
MTIRPARRGARRSVLGWARDRVLLLVAVLFGIVAMHTAGHAMDGSAEAYAGSDAPSAAVAGPLAGLHPAAEAGAPQSAAAHHHMPTDHSALGAAAAFAPDATGAAVSADSSAGHRHPHLGCDLTSMCIGLLAGAAIVLALARTRGAGLPRGPGGGLVRRAAQTAAPAHPPSLLFLSVSRT